VAKIFITGMPGSGKSTLGKNLSVHLSYPFFDLDQIIESMEKKKISEIFSTHGEAFFRTVEHKALNEFIKSKTLSDSYVLALGGGTPCFHDNMSLINQQGVSLFLDTDISIINERMMLQREVSKRPLIAHLKSNQLMADLQEKYEKRSAFYLQSHIKIKGDETLDSISFKVLNYWDLVLKSKSRS